MHINYFEQEKLIAAGESIAEHGASEISDGDVVATHGRSHHVVEVLARARYGGGAT